MSLLVALHTAGQVPTVESLERWLTEQGEPFQAEDDVLALRALPVRLALDDDGGLTATLKVKRKTPLVRLVDLLFDLSVVAGADVVLDGHTLTRAALWLRVADEQDRLRIAAALDQAAERGILDEVMRRRWAVLGALREVRPASVDTLAESAADPEPVAVRTHVHVLAWRWLSGAYPSLHEA